MIDDISRKQVNYSCAIYAVLTILCITFLQNFAYAPIQIRVSEAMCIVALFSKDAPFKLALGCIAANLVTMFIFNTYPVGILDVICGSTATFLGATWCYAYRTKGIPFALLGFVLFNALIVSAYLPVLITDPSAWVVPFISLDIYGNLPLMYLFSVISIGISEGVVMYALGLPFANYLIKRYSKKEESTALE